MPNYTASVPAATAIVGANLTDGLRWARSPANRVLQALGLAGSAAIGDSEVDVYIDEIRVGSFFNTALLFPQVDRDMQPQGDLFIPAGAEIQAIVVNAAATNPLNLTVSLEDV